MSDECITLGEMPSGDPWLLIFQEAVNQGISARLKKVGWSLVECTDQYDDILKQKRWRVGVRNSDSLSELICRLDEMAIIDEDQEAENFFRFIFQYVLGMGEEAEPYLTGVPHFWGCASCGVAMQSEEMELEGYTWKCLSCGDEVDYASRWPYVNLNCNTADRLDLLVERMLANQSSADDAEGNKVRLVE